MALTSRLTLGRSARSRKHAPPSSPGLREQVVGKLADALGVLREHRPDLEAVLVELGSNNTAVRVKAQKFLARTAAEEPLTIKELQAIKPLFSIALSNSAQVRDIREALQARKKTHKEAEEMQYQMPSGGLMPRPTTTRDASAVRDDFADTLNVVAFGNQRIILRRRGKVLAALISIGDFDRFQQLEKEAVDQHDFEEAARSLEDPNEVAIPYEEARKSLGLD